MAYTILLTDIDNTLLDFIAGSHAALRETLEAHGIPFTQERLHQYLTINASLWEAYERGDIPKEAIYLTRFRRLFEALGRTRRPSTAGIWRGCGAISSSCPTAWNSSTPSGAK